MEFPQTLIDRLKSGKVVPFVGAGVSMAVSKAEANETLFPSWKELLERATIRLDAEDKDANAQLVRSLLQITPPDYLEAAKRAREGLGPIWYDFLKEQIDLRSDQADARSLDLARSIWKLNSPFIITTNYDNVLRWSCPDVANLRQLNVQAPVEHVQALRDSLTKPTVWHLHGHIDNAKEIILSPDGYSRLYPEQGKVEPLYQAALATLRSFLTTHSLLFIGFSLDDESFRKQLSHINDIFSGASGPHYILVREANRSAIPQLGSFVQSIPYSDYGQPLLDLVTELAAVAKGATLASNPVVLNPSEEAIPRSASVYDMRNSVFFVPYRSKGDQVVGRDKALRDIRNQLTSERRTSVGQTAAFKGLGGLGKTQLAVEYAYAYREEYPNGVIWLNMDQDIDSQLTELIDQSKWLAPASESKDKLEVARRRLKTFADCLIIFDNVEDIKDIQPYLPEPQVEPHILATSRNELPGFFPVPLDKLDSDHSLKLLIQESGREPPNDGEWEATREIAKLLDGLPLAIELAGAYVGHRGVEWTQYLALLKNSLKVALPGRYLKASFTKHEADLYSTLSIDEELFENTPALRDILDLLTWSGPSPMGFDLMSSILHDCDPAELINALDLGVSLRILQRTKDGVHSIHRLVSEVRREATSLSNRLAWVQETCQSLGNWFEERREEYSRLLQFEMEVDHLRAWRVNALAISADCECRLAWLLAYLPYHRGDYTEAKRCLDEAFGLYQQIHEDNINLKANLLNDLGLVSHELGDYLAAVRYHEDALNFRKKLFGVEHYATARSLNNIGATYCCLGNHRLGLEYNESALLILRKLFGEEHADTARSLNNIAVIYDSLGNHLFGLKYSERALAIRRKLFGEDHPDTAHSLNSIGNAYGKLGNDQLQFEYFEKALAIRRKLFGEEHPSTAHSINNVGSAYGSLGNHRLRLEYFEKALVILRKVFGEEHPDTANSLNNVGSAHGSLGDHRLQLEYCEKGLAIRRKVFGEEHPDIANSFNNVGRAYGDLGDHQLQLEYGEKALAIWRKVFGEEHSDTALSLNNVGAACASLGNHVLGLDYNKKALAIRRKLFGEEHPDTALSLNNVGVAYSTLGDYQVGLEYCENALTIRRGLFGEYHPHTAQSLFSIGTVLDRMGRFQDSLRYLTKALNILDQLMGISHSETIDVLVRLCDVLCKMGQYPKAIQLLDERVRKIPEGDPALKRLNQAKAKVRQALPGSHKRAKPKPRGNSKKSH